MRADVVILFEPRSERGSHTGTCGYRGNIAATPIASIEDTLAGLSGRASEGRVTGVVTPNATPCYVRPLVVFSDGKVDVGLPTP